MRYESLTREQFERFLKDVHKCYRGEPRYVIPYEGHLIAVQDFEEPYPKAGAVTMLASAFMELLINRVYPSIQGSAKFTLQYRLNIDGNPINITLSKAIKLTYADGTRIANEFILKEIINVLNKYAENYQSCDVEAISVRAYSEGSIDLNQASIPTKDESLNYLKGALIKYSDINNLEIPKMGRRSKRRYQSYIPVDKTEMKNKTLFFVADLETLLLKRRDTDVDKTHVPYAGGYMMVDMEKRVNADHITTFYAHDYSKVCQDFHDMSEKMLTEMINRIVKDVQRRGSSMVVYFHNLSQFDGIMILSFLTKSYKNCHIEPIMRNDCIYSIKLYKVSKNGDKRLVLTFMDSYLLLKVKLADLADSFCPELGGKGSFDHQNVTVDKLPSIREDSLTYLKQDILITAAVMQRAKAIIWEEYGIDILKVLTISALALKIFRRVYYKDDDDNRIYIPDDNEAQFIREGYYGGHTDVYKPYGENLYYYDVNSLYPSSMLDDMPIGKTRWVSDLGSKKSKIVLNDMFGFIRAFIICPKHIKKPLLPYKKDDGTIIFPTGRFLGVYFSEELKYAVSLGYKVYPICGYIFDRKESPFKRFVYDIYSKRLDAKAKGEKALDFIYKITMNSLYGRFGISPESTTTQIVSTEESRKLALYNDGFVQSYELSSDKCLVTCKNVRSLDLLKLSSDRPTYAAVQISAAVTGYARIRMHPFISRDDCYYTDTDSVVVERELPEEEVSPTALGKFKHEHFVEYGIFLAPKSYMLKASSVDQPIIKFKGAGKDEADEEWFINQLADPRAKKVISYVRKFSRNFRELLVQEKMCKYTMGLESKKREYVFDKNGVWVDTKPCHIGDFDVKSINPTSYRIIMNLLEENEDLRNEFSNSEIMIANREIKADAAKKRKASKLRGKPLRGGDTPSHIEE